MSLHESLLISMMAMVMMAILWKWSKAFLVVVGLEMGACLVITEIFILGGVLSSMILCLMVFFVCEALIILSSLLSQMRNIGGVYSVGSFF